MPEDNKEPPYKPPLRPLRLIPADASLSWPETVPALSAGQDAAREPNEPGRMFPPQAAEAVRELARQSWLVIEKAAPTLDTLSAALEAIGASEEAARAVQLISTILLALPDQLASGADASVPRVDSMFAQLLNAPGHPGLIQLAIDALALPAASSDTAEAPASHAAAQETLRGLHRALVTLQQRWDELVSALFSMEPFAPASAPPANDNAAASAEAPEDGKVEAAPKASTPLPEGVVVALPAASARSGRSFMPQSIGNQRLRLALVAALLLMVISGSAFLLISKHAPAINPGSDTLTVHQHTPVTVSPTSQPTQVQPTPTRPPPTPTPRPPAPTRAPTPTPTPSPSGPICPNNSAFCVSTLALQVPCAGQGSATLRVTNSTSRKVFWYATSSPSPAHNPLVTITPSNGILKPAQMIILTAQANAQGQKLTGTITIFGPSGTIPVTVNVRVCG
jgi:hypothetical protein